MRNIIYTLFISAFISIMSGCGNGDNSTNTQTIDSLQASTTESTPLLRALVNDSSSIHLTWNASASAISYTLEWGESADSLYNNKYISANETQFTHTNLKEGQIYYYRLVTHFSNDKTSLYSEMLAAKTSSKTQIIQSDMAL